MSAFDPLRTFTETVMLAKINGVSADEGGCFSLFLAHDGSRVWFGELGVGHL
jgi:hypothetical protein